jgi:hypothetical protein
MPPAASVTPAVAVGTQKCLDSSPELLLVWPPQLAHCSSGPVAKCTVRGHGCVLERKNRERIRPQLEPPLQQLPDCESARTHAHIHTHTHTPSHSQRVGCQDQTTCGCGALKSSFEPLEPDEQECQFDVTKGAQVGGCKTNRQCEDRPWPAPRRVACVSSQTCARSLSAESSVRGHPFRPVCPLLCRVFA